MRRARSNDLGARRLHLKVWGPALGAFVVACFVIWHFVPPPLPRTVRLATGPADGHYGVFGVAMRRQLADDGIELQLVATSGSAENIQRLLAGEVDLALIQSGDLTRAEAARLHSVCAVFLEPCFAFYRAELDQTPDWEVPGKRVAAGPEGSGTRVIVTRLLDHVGARPGDAAGTRFLDLGGTRAAAALRRGDVDIAMFVTAPEVPWLPQLFGDENLRVYSFEYAEAWTRRYRYLTQLVIPKGLVDLKRNLPAEDVKVVATTTSVVMRPGVHQGLIPLIIEQCRDELGRGSLLAAPGTFPSPHGVDAPLHDDAAHYFRHGPSFLHRWLPARLAHTVTRMTILILPLLTLLYPLFKGVGPLVRWIARRRVFSWYRVLRALEAELEATDDAEVRAQVQTELERIGDEIRHTQVPVRYAADLFHLRHHHRLLVERVERLERRER